MPQNLEPLQQTPGAGEHRIQYCGDLLHFSLSVPGAPKGKAWLRTNLGNATVRRRELLARTERNEPILERDWHDLQMVEREPGVWIVAVPLTEVGRFEGKCFFLPDDESDTLWPVGGNTVVKVEPARLVAGNTLYSAFVRQFRNGKEADAEVSVENQADVLDGLDKQGYTVIPPSGTFRSLERELDLIIDRLGFRILQLLPIHPVPTTYARMGRFGSPFAALDLMDVDPALAEFDRRTTPMDQFEELIDAVHARGARLFLDMPMNHTGWASRLQVHHPEWYKRHAHNGEFRSPGAWGVTWADLSELDFQYPELREYMARVLLFWCARGVDGFRCDAGYMIPVDAWRYIIAKVRKQYPETTFLLEGLGGKLSVTQALLDDANMDWAYSELFQNYDRGQIEYYLPGAVQTSENYGCLVNFAETHDNNRLAADGRVYSTLRCALTALCSSNGAFGITNGVEWFATAKIDVHGASPMRWGAPENQVDFIARLAWLLNHHPAFWRGAKLRLVHGGAGNFVVVLREYPREPEFNVLIVANLDCGAAVVAEWPAGILRSSQIDDGGDGALDWVSGERVQVIEEHGGARIELAAGQVVCLACGCGVVDDFARSANGGIHESEAVRLQRLRAVALQLRMFYSSPLAPAVLCDKTRQVATAEDCRLRGVTEDQVDGWALSLARDPEATCAEIANRPVVLACVPWDWPRDLHRTVPLARGQALMVRAPHRFRCRLLLPDTDECLQVEDGFKTETGDFIAFVCPLLECGSELELESVVYTHEGATRARTRLCVGNYERFDSRLRTTVARDEPGIEDVYALCTNGRGAYSQVRAEWAGIRSQYDAILAANLHSQVPVDRRVLFTRCRAWVVNRGYSQELNSDSLKEFGRVADGSIRWEFDVPVGMGHTIPLHVRLSLLRGRNAVRLKFERGRSTDERVEHCLDDKTAIRLILRPDIEDRNCHEKTKAYAGAETLFPESVHAENDGFAFAPYEHDGDEHGLLMRLENGRFMQESEWVYMVEHPFERQRGLDDSSDLFSPGYFEVELVGGDSVVLSAGCLSSGEDGECGEDMEDGEGILRRAIADFVVKRDEHSTVIAGYPWFLDWGRDTLICLRGIIAAGMLDEAEDILVQFAKFEKGGTIPNMIRGEDDSNRDTSDAPLWLYVAARDLYRLRGDVLERDCGGRTLREVLGELARNLKAGTENGIRVDSESGLVFSPSHFTWMDTNFPAGTPRQGYPIEIQALWFAALDFLAEIDPENDGWRREADRVQESIRRLFRLGNGQGLSDCLHADPDTPASAAVADDALRPNQLLAVTLGAVADKKLAEEVLRACRELLIPGAIRSLADRPVHPPLIVERDGHVLNDPSNPYWGVYAGDEDTRRKPAYHNGTAWTWPFPSYAEALCAVHGDAARAVALDLLATSLEMLNAECIGQICEVLDADAPHAQRGCGAQAWGVTELYRVFTLLG